MATSMGLKLTFRDREILGLPAPTLVEHEELPAVRCGDCGDLLNEHARADRCAPCNARARGKYYAGVFASAARVGMEVDDGITASFCQHLPAALARKGLLLEREGLRWVVKRGPRS